MAATGVITAIRDTGGVPMALVETVPAEAGAGAPGVRTVSACLLTCPEAAVGATVVIHSGYVMRVIDGPGPGRDHPS